MFSTSDIAQAGTDGNYSTASSCLTTVLAVRFCLASLVRLFRNEDEFDLSEMVLIDVVINGRPEDGIAEVQTKLLLGRNHARSRKHARGGQGFT